jgi:hypothetical protein
MSYKEIAPLSITDTFSEWRSKVNSWGNRLNDIRLITEPDTLYTAADNEIPRVADVKAFVIAMSLILE